MRFKADGIKRRKLSLPEFQENIKSGTSKKDPETEVSYIQFENFYADWPKEEDEKEELDKAGEAYLAYCEGENQCVL